MLAYASTFALLSKTIKSFTPVQFQVAHIESLTTFYCIKMILLDLARLQKTTGTRMSERKFKVVFALVMLYYACIGGLLGLIIVSYYERHPSDQYEIGASRRK